MEIAELNRLFGNIDIYLLDQILKGRFGKGMKILDAGCGEGRNSVYFIKSGYQVFGIDQQELAIQYIRFLSKSLDPNYDVHRFQVARLEEIPFHAAAFDVVICSAVLHFAVGKANFWEMINELLRVLKPGGVFWLRMTTGFGGILEASQELGDGRFLLPDETERFLIDQDLLDQLLAKGLKFLEMPKSVLVHGQRTMGVFVFEKNL